MRKSQILFLLPLFVWQLPLSLATDVPEENKNWGGLDVMNGIRMADFAGFEEKWKLVTVRFRKDTGELRFTYANPKAWQTLKAGKIDYPEGAVFAKIGFVSEEDPVFPNSAVPSGAKRVQFMVRNKKKFVETDGWGYALFKGNGVTYNDDPKVTTIGCHACHKIVTDRGFVFSVPAAFSTFANQIEKNHAQDKGEKKNTLRISFRTGSSSELPKRLLDLLKPISDKIRFVEGEMTKSVFQGTLNELKPLLAVETL